MMCSGFRKRKFDFILKDSVLFCKRLCESSVAVCVDLPEK